MQKPLVSVVTVVYNDVQHIEQTMLSVLNQTYKPVEYIIIDGGSNDGTVDIIKKYADKLAYWVSAKDGGIYDAMNKGIEQAKGEWLNFMNSGDYFVSNTVFAEIFDKDHSTSDMLYGSFIGNFNGTPVLCSAHTDAAKKTWQGMPLGQQALFARTALMKSRPFNLKYKVSADGDFVAWCASTGKVFERLDLTVFCVGTLGFSFDHWLRARVENWKIARLYFPGLRTDIFHAWGFVKTAGFRSVKAVLSWVGVYQVIRWVYRKYFKKTFPILPKNSFPMAE